MDQFTVLLVEDNRNTRDRLANIIIRHPSLKLLAGVGTFSEARQNLKQSQPDVLLCDLGLPDGDGLDLIIYAKSKYRDVEVMVISIFGDEKHSISAIEAGASSYLLKDGDADYIGDSIMQMMEGGSPISPSIARHLLKRFRGPTYRIQEHQMPALSKREQEVLQQLAKGYSYADIAGLLEISPHTVTTYIKRIYKKLTVRSRGEAVFEAQQMGLID